MKYSALLWTKNQKILQGDLESINICATDTEIIIGTLTSHAENTKYVEDLIDDARRNLGRIQECQNQIKLILGIS